MIKYGYIKNGICYVDGLEGEVVKHKFSDGKIKIICISCYKQIVPPAGKPKSKPYQDNWGNTSVEKEFARAWSKLVPNMFHELVAIMKGSEKCCLIRNKPKMEVLSWMP